MWRRLPFAKKRLTKLILTLSVYIFLLSSFVEMFPVSYFSIPLSFYFDDKIYLVVIVTPQWVIYLDIINTFLLWGQNYV